ncbi:unnamed protein product [Lactuca saligna]|uniref:Alcohol dehydrogenase-like C-terminal domain-containing protein n=1 Tax=Lactuca saligna TaxID=75948 RepID=A0AA36EDN0_LACSI|nr:unnamed protein product [Lactuca saligna]
MKINNLISGVGAAWKAAKVEIGTRVAIFGLGAMGLAIDERARLCGAKRIIRVDLNQYNFEIRKKFGVTDFVNPRNMGTKLLASGKSIMGSLFGGLKPKSDIPILKKCCMDKELQLDAFVTHEVEFEDINKAFDLLHQGKSLPQTYGLRQFCFFRCSDQL